MLTLKKSLTLLMLMTSGDIVGETKTAQNFLLSKNTVGPTKTGSSVDALFRRYGRDAIQLVDLRLEGSFTPALQVYINGKQRDDPAFVAEFEWSRQVGWGIYRIEVLDLRFKTSRGIGIGSTLGELRLHYKIEFIASGEGSTFAFVPELGMSFSLDIDAIPSEWYKSHDDALVPDSAKIVSVLVL